MNKKLTFILFIFLCAIPVSSFAKTITGVVKNTDNETLPGASIYWIDSKLGTISGEDGKFSISDENISDKRLIVSYTGYKADSLEIEEQNNFTVELNRSANTDEVIVERDQNNTYISDASVAKEEVITQGEMEKAACCDLAGAFHTNASVEKTTTNVITNSEELRILGLSGIYNQVLFDGFPIFNGLAYTYGINSIPGPLIDKIHVSKGTNSVLQGAESISGQINVTPKVPGETDNLYANLFLGSKLETQYNLLYSESLNESKDLTNLAFLHVTQPSNAHDLNGDSFLDMPKVTRYMFFDKMSYGVKEKEGWNSEVGFILLNEERIGGQLRTLNNKGDIYTQSVEINQPTVYTKSGYRFNDDQAIRLFASSYYNKQNSKFGYTNYNADQFNLWSKLQFHQNWAESNDLKFGVSFQRNRLDENIDFDKNPLDKTFQGNYLKNETIYGIFAENIFYFLDDDLTLFTGIRADNHNEFDWLITPRSIVKYNFNDMSNVRLSAGYGWRTANIFSENINLLASQRNIIFEEELKPEKAMNLGANYTHRFEISEMTGNVSFDFYHIRFSNQIFPDYYVDPTLALVSNFEGTSISNGIQAEFNINLTDEINFKTAYNFLESYRLLEEGNYHLPFIPKHKFLTSISYREEENWHANINANFFGVKKLPVTDGLPEDLQIDDKSKPYVILNLQYTKIFGGFEVYTGVENLLNFRQKNPIISWDAPYSKFFDTSYTWGPTRGIEFYLGLRYKIGE